MTASAMRAMEIVSKATDAKQAIIDTVGDLSDVEVIGDMVLIGIYFRPEKTRGGILLPGVVKQEDAWQGKVGLVLKWGPDAFRDKETGELFEQRCEVGEWGVFKVGDAWQLDVNDYPCRLARDSSLRLIVKRPDMIR